MFRLWNSSGFLLALLAICLLSPGWAGRAATPDREDPGHFDGKPIPSGTDAVTAQTRLKPLVAWWTRMLLDPYNKSPNADPKVAAFIQEAISYDSYFGQGKSAEELQEEAADLESRGANDPCFFFAAALVQRYRRESNQYYYRALEGFEKIDASSALKFAASVNIGRGLELASHADTRADEYALKYRDQVSLAYLKAMLNDYPFGKDEDEILMTQLANLGVYHLYAGHAAEANKILAESGKIPEWIMQYWLGQQYIIEARKLAGAAHGSPPAGDLAANLAQAREHLVKSWELHPSDPNAATAMIEVAMDEQEKIESVRTWFDRAMAAQIDNWWAYNAMFDALRTTRLGSRTALLRFGEDCRANGRFDTDVPYRYMNVIRIVACEIDHSGALLEDPAINRKLLTILERYLTAPDWRLYDQKDYVRALAAVVAYKGGRLDLAQKHMEEIGYDIDPWADELKVYADIPVMMRQIRAYQGDR